MDCHVIKVEQGSEAWLAARRGRITASRLADVMAKPTTKRYQQYRREKVLELLGHEAVEETPEWFEHGRAFEPRAIAAYEWKYGIEVEHDVFLVSKKWDWLGASPDLMHLPNMDDGCEIKGRALFKNYRMHVQMAKHFEGTPRACSPENRHQVQGNMMLTGFDRWGLINYYEGEDIHGVLQRKLHHVWIPRDEVLISEMEVRCLEFMADVYDLAGK